MGDRPAALACLAAALAAWPSAAGLVSRRARRLAVVPARGARGWRRRPDLPPSARRWLFAGAAGLTATVLAGGPWGPLLGAASTVLVERLLRRGSASTAGQHERLAADLPLVCELLAVCLEAGVPPGGAVAAVSAAAPEPLAGPLNRVAGLYRLGAEPARAWADAPTAMDALARAFVRAGASGSGVGPALRAVAGDLRASSRARTEAAVRRAGVWVLAPLGACFLPAFLCLGVVPLVIGIARDVFG